MRFRLFALVALLALLGSSACATSIRLTGPHVSGSEIVVLTNNLDVPLEVWRTGKYVGVIPPRGTVRLGFGFWDNGGMIVTVKAFREDLGSPGGRKYLGLAEQTFYYYPGGSTQLPRSWVVTNVY